MTTLDTINATLATVNSDERVATTYSASAHRVKDGMFVVESTRITVEGDDDAESSAFTQQEASDRVMTRAMEAAGFVMLDAGANGGGAGYWSTWMEAEAL